MYTLEIYYSDSSYEFFELVYSEVLNLMRGEETITEEVEQRIETLVLTDKRFDNKKKKSTDGLWDDVTTIPSLIFADFNEFGLAKI